jgi:hypothetical protein
MTKAEHESDVRSAIRGYRPGFLAMLVVVAFVLVGWILKSLLPDRSLGSRYKELVNFRAFTSSSYWNTPLPVDAPVDPDSARIIAFLNKDNARGEIRVAGVSAGGQWGNPIYVARDGDPTYSIVNTCEHPQPPEFRSLRIPDGAAPDPTSDASMTVYDMGKRTVYGFFHTEYDPLKDEWRSCGGAVYYLGSNGLDGTLAQSDDPRNFGHRGVPPPVFAVRYDEIRAGSIDHVLKIAADTTRCEHVFPMTGDECGTMAIYAPPEGTRIRLKPSIDLSRMRLSRPVLIIARALQRYGAIIGDESGTGAELKVENTVAEGRGPLWKGLISEDSLAMFPFSDFEVIQLSYEA